MTAATPATAQLLTEQKIYSDTYEVEASELLNHAAFCPTQFYVRGNVANIAAEDIEQLKEDLIFRGENGEKPVVRVTNSLTVFEFDGKLFYLAGNSRVRCITEMLNDTKYKGMTFQPVSIKRLLVEPTYETLVRLQISDNDTTNRHQIIDVCKTVSGFYQNAFERAVSSGKNEKQAGAIATQACVVLTGKSQAYVGQLIKLATMPDWLLTHVQNKRLNADTAINMQRFSDSSGMPLESVFQGAESLAVGSPAIYKKQHLDKFIKSVGSGKTETNEGGSGEGSEGGSSGSGEGGSTAAPRKVVDPKIAEDSIFESLTALQDLEVEEVNDLHMELLAKTNTSTAKILSSALKAQVIDVSKAASVLPSVAETLKTLLNVSAFTQIDPNAMGDDDEEVTRNTKRAVSALKVAGQMIGLMFAESLISDTEAGASLDSLKIATVTLFDALDLKKAFNPEELTQVYNQFNGLNKSLGLIQNDGEVSEVTDDELEDLEGELDGVDDDSESLDDEDLTELDEVITAIDGEFTATVE